MNSSIQNLRTQRASVIEKGREEVQTLSTSLLTLLARSCEQNDVGRMLSKECAARGVNLWGDWVGFPEAAVIWGVAA